MEYKKHPDRDVRHLLGGPFIYSMIIPLIILDIFAEVYHHVCFRLYGIPLLNRSRYIRFDRHKLKYLSTWEKINCSFCAYANGLMFYGSMIAAETEKYWCAVKHENKKDFASFPHQSNFIAYGDEKAYSAIGKQNKGK